MVRQLAADKGRVYARLRAIHPSGNFWLCIFDGLQRAQAFRHGHNVQQRHAGLEFEGRPGFRRN